MMHIPAEAMIRVSSAHITPNAGAPTLDLDASKPVTWIPTAAEWLQRKIRFGGTRLGVAISGDTSEAEYALLRHVHAHYEAAKIAEQTVINQAARFATNFCRALKACPSWATMLDKPLRGRTAFVVGAGVSLDACGPLLAAAQRKGFVIAVNSAARACLRYGVTPDLVMCSEALSVASHFEGVDTLCALDTNAHPDNWAAAGARAMAFTNHEHGFLQYLLELGAAPLPYTAAVFNAAVSLAHWWGAERVVLIGQNLGFADGRMYAHGSPFDDLRYELRDGVVYTTGASKEIDPMPAAYRAGWTGEPDVLSNHSFDAEAEWLMRAARCVPIVNCSVGGAAIENADHCELSEALAGLGDMPRLAIEPPAPVDTLRVVSKICDHAARYLAAPTHSVPSDFPLLYMYAAPVLIQQGSDDEATRDARLQAAMVAGCREMLDVLG